MFLYDACDQVGCLRASGCESGILTVISLGTQPSQPRLEMNMHREKTWWVTGDEHLHIAAAQDKATSQVLIPTKSALSF